MSRSRAAKQFNEPAQLPLPLPLTDPRLSSAASCRDAVVLPRWGGENRRSGGRFHGAHRRLSPGRLRPLSSRSQGENTQARRPQACTQANNPEAQGPKHWTARVIHLARKVQTVVRNRSNLARKPADVARKAVELITATSRTSCARDWPLHARGGGLRATFPALRARVKGSRSGV